VGTDLAGYERCAAGWPRRSPTSCSSSKRSRHLVFFDHYSHFTLGVGEKYWVADEGGGARKLPPIKGHPALARHVANAW